MIKYTALILSVLNAPLVMALDANKALLPEDYKVYTLKEGGIINHQAPDSTEKVLPTVNHFKEAPGCYIACYSHNAAQAIYPVGKNIYVMGQIRVPGSYQERVCQPKGFEQKDISAAQEFKALCTQIFPDVCREGICWAGGDTGGWFGIQGR